MSDQLIRWCCIDLLSSQGLSESGATFRKATSQARIVYGTETPERKSSAEQLNGLILIEGTYAHVTRFKFSKNKASRIDQPEKTLGGAI